MKTTTLFIFLILFLVSSFLISIESVDKHEGLHQKIYEAFGVGSKIECDALHLNCKTIAVSNISLCTEDCLNLQLLNEIVSYNLDEIFFEIVIGFAFLILVCGYKR